MGQIGISGSPSKYSCVIRRWQKAWPKTETWICAGRQLLTQLQSSPRGQTLLLGMDTDSFVAANDADFEVVRTFLKEFDTLVQHKK